jgi:hypothetical protein
MKMICPALMLVGALVVSTAACVKKCPDDPSKCPVPVNGSASSTAELVSNRQYYWITPNSPYTLSDVLGFLGNDPPKVGACSKVSGESWKHRLQSAAAMHNKLSQKELADSPVDDWFEGKEVVESAFTAIVANGTDFTANANARFSKSLSSEVGTTLSSQGADFVIAAPRRRISTTATARECIRDSFCALHDKDSPKPKAAVVTGVLYGSMVRLTMSSNALSVKAKTDIADVLSVSASFSTQKLTMAGGVIGGFSVDGAKLGEAAKAHQYDVPEIIDDVKALRFIKLSSKFGQITSAYGVLAIAVTESPCP